MRFTAPVNTHFIKLRCLPCVNACQRIVREELIIHPQLSTTEGKDAFGNRIIVGSSLDPHDSLAYISSGIVELDEYRIPDTDVPMFYLTATERTRATKEMTELPFTPTGNKLYDAQNLCQMVFEHMTYETASTDINTTAAQAFANRKGVCQDYAHILIALCRHYGIHARYANGFIVGEGATHAWVEVFADNCWHAFDPTHGWAIIDYGYIKLAHGRDAADCPVSRGTYTGSASQQTEIRVIVNDL